MATIRLYLDTRSKSKDDLYPLVVRISVKNTTAHINTGIRIKQNQFDGNKIIGHPNLAKLNMIAKTKVSQIEIAVTEMQLKGELKGKTAIDIKKMIEHDDEETKSDNILIDVFFDEFIDKCNAENTKEVYRYTLATLKRFRDISSLRIDDINIAFLKSFESWLIKNNIKTNTISIHMRNLRAILNAAIDDNKLSLDKYPFRRYRIKTAQTIKRSLTIDELRILRDYNCEEHQRKYRDIFMLSFYLAGINMVDLLNLPNNNSCKAEYIRSKTKIPCCIDIPQEAMDIINRYRGDKYLIYPMDKYSNHKDFIHRMNINLQQIGEVTIEKKKCGRKTCEIKKYKPLYPNLTTYWARHTWATIAAELDIPDAVIDMALVHKSPYPMSDIYIRRNQQKVNEAIRLVIDKIKGAPD